MTVIRHPNNQGVTLSQWRKTAAGGETSVSGTDDFSAGLAYTAGAEQVFVNGVLLERGVDYTASTGTTVTGLTALVAGDIVTVSSPSAFNVANAIPKATITAKGDLLVGTGASTPTNLGVGADGTTLVANSASATGVAWAGPTVTAGKNAIINGNFDIAQRSTSSTAGGYCSVDRWYLVTVGGATFAQQTTTVPAGSRYALQMTASGTGQQIAYQAIETANAYQFAGQNATFSVLVSASTSTGMTIDLQYSTTVDAAVTSGGSWTTISATSGGTGTAISGSFSKITGVYAVPSTAKSLMVRIYTSAAISSGVSVYAAQAQLELGSVATAFSRAGGTLQGELAACQRYYYRISTNAPYSWVSGIGLAYSTTSADVPIPFPVTMRTTSTAIDYANIWLTDDVATFSTGTFTNNGGYNNTQGNVRYVHGTAALTQYRPYFLQISTSGGYLGFTAEL